MIERQINELKFNNNFSFIKEICKEFKVKDNESLVKQLVYSCYMDIEYGLENKEGAILQLRKTLSKI